MYEIIYQDVEPKKEYEQITKKVLTQCFKEENLENSKLNITITLTTPNEIRKINKEFRNIDKATDVLSFQVEKQAQEYNHSFERELSYMLVHGFYHLMGYDHIKEEDKKIMRPKEEKILTQLKISRD